MKVPRWLYCRFPCISVKHKLDLFDKLVNPILSYGCEVWGLCESHVLEKVRLNFCKKLLEVRATTQNSFVYGELGRTTLLTKPSVSVIKYWLKLLD